DGVDILSKVLDEQQQTESGTNEGAGDKLEVLDVPKYRSESKEESWTFSQGEDEDEDEEHDSDDDNYDNDDEDDDKENDNQRTESDNEGDDFVHPNLSTYIADDQEKEEEKADDDDDDVTSGQKVSTPPDYELTEEDENKQDEGDEDNGELYEDLNINLSRSNAEITDAQTNPETKEAQVTLTTEPPVVQLQSSSASSNLVAKFINPSPDTCIESILNPNAAVSVTHSSAIIIPQTPIPIIQPQQQTHNSTTTTTIPTTTVLEIPNKQTNQFAKALSSIMGIVDKYLATKVKDTVDVAVQLKSNKLREEAQAENQDFLNSLDSNMKRIIKEQVKAQTSKIMTKVEKYVTETLGAEVLVRSTNQPQMSYAVASSLSELELKKILMDKMELVTLKRGRDDQDKDEEPSAGLNHGSRRQRSG
ncbi:hypothetical protein Tco_1567315, partial [Tanacetum coccineum]